MSGYDPASITEFPTQVVIPYREVDQARRTNRERAYEFWFNMGHVPQFVDSGHEQFNRAASINQGVNDAWFGKGETVIVADVDVTGDALNIETALRLVSGGDPNVFLPYDKLYFFDETNKNIPGPPYIGNVSCIQVMRRETYELVGGNDDRFQGWGFEDNAFAARVKKADLDFIRFPGPAYHHWHPVYWSVGDENYERNRILWETEYVNGQS